MCIVALALDCHPRFPLVIAANRDEFLDRPTARLAWWHAEDPEGPGTPILGGRDLKEGGTWLGLNPAGRLALVTNIRQPLPPDAPGPSRGHLVPLWLRAQDGGALPALSGYKPVNLLAADFAEGECWWTSSMRVSATRLGPGLHGLSNAELDTPWPKVQKLKQRVAGAFGGRAAESLDALVSELFAALSDRTWAADADLPRTGVSLEWERALSAIFIRSADGRYGTRCSTLVITERQQERRVTHVLERSFPSGPGLALLRHVTLDDWPAQRQSARGDSAGRMPPVREADAGH
jgi:uncharacterized protein with NRDE domain